jgi:hypothetical protein
MKPINLEGIRNVLWHAEHDPNARALLGTPELRGLVDLVDAQTGALLDVEWSFVGDLSGMERFECPACNVRKGIDHRARCSIDAALTVAGFPDPASRDAERARRAGR